MGVQACMHAYCLYSNPWYTCLPGCLCWGVRHVFNGVFFVQWDCVIVILIKWVVQLLIYTTLCSCVYIHKYGYIVIRR